MIYALNLVDEMKVALVMFPQLIEMMLKYVVNNCLEVFDLNQLLVMKFRDGRLGTGCTGFSAKDELDSDFTNVFFNRLFIQFGAITMGIVN